MIAAVMGVVGLAILIYRRRTVGRVFTVTTRMDKLMYVVLGAVVLLGVYNTVGTCSTCGDHPGGYNYRETVAVWFRSLFVLQPRRARRWRRAAVVPAARGDRHAAVRLIPFTRLVHIFSAPVGYLSRPYVVYRSRDPEQVGNRDPRRGWEPIKHR